MTLIIKCDCGKVTVNIPHAPYSIMACSCRFCQITGARWAYFPKDDISVQGQTDTYQRGQRRLDFHRCSHCGVITHWVAVTVDWKNSGVNTANAELSLLQDVAVEKN